MDRSEAKRILSIYRPDSGDETDPQFSEALAFARNDAELGRWLEGQKKLHRVVRHQLRSIEVPEDLRDQILAARKVVRPAIWWKRPSLLAVAAGIAFLLSLSFFWMADNQRNDFTEYRVEMARFVSADYRLDFAATDLNEVKRVLTQMHWPSDYVLPQALVSGPLEGGCALRWRGKKVTLICWETHDEPEHDIWLFVMPREGVANGPEGEQPQISRIGELITATWRRDNNTYLLALEGDEAAIKKLL